MNLTFPRLTYIAHPIGRPPDRDKNLQRVLRWFAWAIVQDPNSAFVIPYKPYCDVLEETDENRARGIRDDLVALSRCDNIWLVGGLISPGMQGEFDYMVELGRPVHDFTALGPEPPVGPVRMTGEQTPYGFLCTGWAPC